MLIHSRYAPTLVATGGRLRVLSSAAIGGRPTAAPSGPFDQDTGAVLWEHARPINLGSPVSGYPITCGLPGRTWSPGGAAGRARVDGRQYVAGGRHRHLRQRDKSLL